MPEAIRNDLKRIRDKALEGRAPTDSEALFLAALPADRLPELCAAALMVKERFFGRTVAFCSIVNAKSGRCSEDCAFCAQSAHHEANVSVHGFLGVEAVRKAAMLARAAGARRFSIVASGLTPGPEEFDELLRCVAEVQRLGLAPDASVGLLDPDRLTALRNAGLAMLHHNLETSRGYFPNVCTTHAYDDNVDCVRQALAMGLPVCCGGVLGLGEGWEHRLELADTLCGLGVMSVPVNFLTPIPGTPLEGRPVMEPAEALKILAVYRLLLPNRHIRVCGGRARVFGEDRARVLAAGASGLMVGNYLTTMGVDPADDHADARRLGLRIV